TSRPRAQHCPITRSTSEYRSADLCALTCEHGRVNLFRRRARSSFSGKDAPGHWSAPTPHDEDATTTQEKRPPRQAAEVAWVCASLVAQHRQAAENSPRSRRRTAALR